MQEYVKRFGKAPAPQEQVDLVLKLMREGKTQQEVLADERVQLKTTKVYEIFRYNKAALAPGNGAEGHISQTPVDTSGAA